MKRVATFIFGLLAGFAILWLNQKVDFGGGFAKLTINRQTADFFENIFQNQLKSEFAVVALYTFSKSLIVCAPLGLLAGFITNKLQHKRTFLYSILIWPTQHLLGIFAFEKLSAVTNIEFIFTANYRGHIYSIQLALISFIILYIFIFIMFSIMNRNQPNPYQPPGRQE